MANPDDIRKFQMGLEELSLAEDGNKFCECVRRIEHLARDINLEAARNIFEHPNAMQKLEARLRSAATQIRAQLMHYADLEPDQRVLIIDWTRNLDDRADDLVDRRISISDKLPTVVS